MTRRRDHTTVRHFARRLLIGLALVALPLSACSAGPSAEGPEPPPSSRSTTVDGDAALTPPDSTILALASGSEVYFARQKPGADYADGLLAGRLSLDQGGCLRMKESSGGSHVLVWPAKFEPGTTGEGGRDVEVLDGQGRAVARVGEKATLGGGEVSGSLEGFSAVDDRTARELRDRCPGNYWLVSEYSE